MTDTPGEREESLDVIQRELTAFARRARAAAARLHPELPLVSYTLLAHIDDRHGCRATDLAAHYMLDKSTVSRQIRTLEKLGLVERHPDPADHRIQVLHPTEAGTRALASTQASRRTAYQERLAEWTSDDLARFAEYLLRYNASGGTSSQGTEEGHQQA
ncbi:MarR family winged helix-turn-helix transcriptional regulator [Streptomyces sp. JH14]|uniref:MarR family winged helix-turn-helix transcriptional regulator n=1 Tax=Streptomyces sp. JH14 TaxID=2793630 RepID=UPI0023F85F09|nr:MarR family winged helix-turn-helix transcriptional regulator [Streptomyces sp. JH14]MDF6043638.1 MarR family winged helix-turn-helix transcriptional regulator [Streptomyces sp. JH14]